MDSTQLRSAADIKQYILQQHIEYVKVGVFDIDGVMRGKYMSANKFLTALDKGFGFCDVVLGWDTADQLYDNVDFTGWHTGYPDANVRLLPETCRRLPFEDGGLFVLGEFQDKAAELCPRNLLKRVLERANNSGYQVMCGFEYEFFVFDETPQSVRDKQFQQLTPMAPAEFGYSVIRNSVEADVYRSLLQLSREMDFELEGLHEETGPGVLEAAIGYDEALASADKAALFKTFSKVALQKMGKMATFMARWSEKYPGQSGHIHLSIRDQQGKSVFYDADQPHGVSEVMRHFLGGQQKLMPELLAMIAPNINSYRRLIPGFWAPTEASVGVDNRTCAIRIIPGSASSQRLEYRIAAADANPYIILSAALASGLWGIEQQIEPEPFVEGNAYEQQFPPHLQLSNNLWDAAQQLRQSKMARTYFGDAFVDHYAATREWEVRQFQKHISQWELNRYFEII